MCDLFKSVTPDSGKVFLERAILFMNETISLTRVVDAGVFDVDAYVGSANGAGGPMLILRRYEKAPTDPSGFHPDSQYK